MKSGVSSRWRLYAITVVVSRCSDRFKTSKEGILLFDHRVDTDDKNRCLKSGAGFVILNSTNEIISCRYNMCRKYTIGR